MLFQFVSQIQIINTFMKIYGTQIPPKYISLDEVEQILNKQLNFQEWDFNLYNDLDYSDLCFYFQEKLKHSNLTFYISNEVIQSSKQFDFDLYYDLHHERDTLIDRTFLFYLGISVLDNRNLKSVENIICGIFNCSHLNFWYLDEVSHLQF